MPTQTFQSPYPADQGAGLIEGASHVLTLRAQLQQQALQGQALQQQLQFAKQLQPLLLGEQQLKNQVTQFALDESKAASEDNVAMRTLKLNEQTENNRRLAADATKAEYEADATPEDIAQKRSLVAAGVRRSDADVKQSDATARHTDELSQLVKTQVLGLGSAIAREKHVQGLTEQLGEWERTQAAIVQFVNASPDVRRAMQDTFPEPAVRAKLLRLDPAMAPADAQQAASQLMASAYAQYDGPTRLALAGRMWLNMAMSAPTPEDELEGQAKLFQINLQRKAAGLAPIDALPKSKERETYEELTRKLTESFSFNGPTKSPASASAPAGRTVTSPSEVNGVDAMLWSRWSNRAAGPPLVVGTKDIPTKIGGPGEAAMTSRQRTALRTRYTQAITREWKDATAVQRDNFKYVVMAMARANDPTRARATMLTSIGRDGLTTEQLQVLDDLYGD